jgi:hypothetical protein
VALGDRSGLRPRQARWVCSTSAFFLGKQQPVALLTIHHERAGPEAMPTETFATQPAHPINHGATGARDRLIPLRMPASYRVDLRSGVVFTVCEGRVTNEELLDHQHRLSADPNFRPTMNHVIDTRAVTDVSVTALGLRLLATRSNLGPGSRRMFETLRSQSGADIKIFSTVEDAPPLARAGVAQRHDVDS